MTPTPDPSDRPDDWTTPGLYAVADGVYRIPLPLPNDGLRAVNVYAVVDADGLVVVDSGWSIPEARELLASSLAVIDAGLGDIRRFLITHVHRDHYTQAVAVRREFGMRVSLGAGERPALEVIQQPGRSAFHPQLEALASAGAAELVRRIVAARADGPAPQRSDWEFPDDWLAAGPVALASGRTLQVIETPGHTRGHVVFHDADARLLFAGDHVLPSITPSIGFEPLLSPNPLGDFLASLARVRALPDAVLLPAHGQVTDSVHARVDQLVDHHGARLDATEAAVVAGATTAYEAAGRLGWTRRNRSLTDLDEFNQMLAVGETATHLDLLVAQGRLLRSSEDGVTLYRAA